MTTLAIALKDEIRRLARKEIKAQTGKQARAVAQYRREIAKLSASNENTKRRSPFLKASEKTSIILQASLSKMEKRDSQPAP